jgi:NDP-sugar pyrophosphorylase family protein
MGVLREAVQDRTALLIIIIFKEIILKLLQLKANVNHIILAVSYRAELLEQQIKAKEKEVSIHYLLNY